MIKQYLNLIIAGAAVAAVLSFGGYVWHMKASVKRAEARAEAADTRAGKHAMAASQWEIDGLQARVDLSECQAQWEQTRASAVEMIAESTRRRIQAEAEAQTWRKRWDARPQGCSAALASLDTACPALDGY